MKIIINAIKDFLYTITDYGIILLVVSLMALVLLWRFDILFNKGIDKEVIASIPPPIEEPSTPNITTPANPNGSTDPAKPEDPTDTPNTQDPPTDDNTVKDPNLDKPIEGGTVTVTVPAGAFPSKIGDILIEKGLITSKNDFLNRAVELELDTKLKQGDFDITLGTPLDDIIKIIAQVK